MLFERHGGVGGRASVQWSRGLNGLEQILLSCHLGEASLSVSLLTPTVSEGALCQMQVLITTLLLQADEMGWPHLAGWGELCGLSHSTKIYLAPTICQTQFNWRSVNTMDRNPCCHRVSGAGAMDGD